MRRPSSTWRSTSVGSRPVTAPAPRIALRRRGLIVLAGLFIALAAGCAGPLDDPGRFLYLLDGGADDGGDPDGGSDAGPPDAGDAGSDGGAPDAGHDGGAGSDGGSPDAGCDPVKTFFIPTCATGLCHGNVIQQASLDLESAGMPQRLINQPGFGGPGVIIDPVDPDKSLLFTKVGPAPPFNFQMPLGLDPLSPAEVACLRAWIHAAVGK